MFIAVNSMEPLDFGGAKQCQTIALLMGVAHPHSHWHIPPTHAPSRSRSTGDRRVRDSQNCFRLPFSTKLYPLNISSRSFEVCFISLSIKSCSTELRSTCYLKLISYRTYWSEKHDGSIQNPDAFYELLVVGNRSYELSWEWWRREHDLSRMYSLAVQSPRELPTDNPVAIVPTQNFTMNSTSKTGVLLYPP